VSPASGPRLHCPYCYEGFAEQQIRFRCAGRISRDGRRCDPEIDEVLRSRTGFSGALPPTFAANGRLTSAACPRCGAETTTRVCPACHSQLPVHFGKVRSRLIVLVGAKESGKTVFMTVLVHELMHQLGEQLKAAISGADDGTRHRFASEYEKPLYREAQLLAPTTTAGMRNRVPLVFRFTTGGRGLFGGGLFGLDGRLGRSWPGRGGPQHTLLSFFDPAGEDLRSQQSVEQNVRYLAAADGIVLLLDPLQMRGARQLAAPGSRLPTPGTTDDEPATVLANITDLVLATAGRKPNELISKPLAIVFSKMDVLRHDLRETSPLRRPPVQAPYFDERDSQEVHTEIQRLLARWEGSRIDQIAQLHYRNYRYFGVSALGETPTPDNRVSARGIRPYRVGDPFMWTLAQLGAIRVKRG
jgi:hypothetical protein